MKKLASVAALGTFFLLLTSGAQAQTAGPSPFGNRENSQGEAYLPPAVFVDQVTVENVSAQSVVGSFVVSSQNQDAVGDLRYRLEVLSPLPPESATAVVEDAPDIYDIWLAPEVFALAPSSQKILRFGYSAPPLPAGDYRLRVQIVTSQGRKLGWQDVALKLPGSDIQFVKLLPGAIALPEFPHEIIPPSSGPNVAPGGSLTLQATVQNPHAAAFTFIPVLTTYQFALEKGQATSHRLDPIVVGAGEEKTLSLPVQAATEPAVYESWLALEKDGLRVSPLVEYRWVVTGEDAHIISARIQEMARQAGQIMTIQVEYAGPGDAQTSLTGTLEITVRDEQGDVGTTTVPDLPLSDRIESGLVQVELSRELVGAPALRVTLKDSSGAILDTYDIAIPLTEAELAALPSAATPALLSSYWRWAVAALAGLGVAGIVLILWHVLRQRPQPPAPPLPAAPAVLLVGLILSAVGFAGAGTAWALGSGNGINVFVPPTGCQFHQSWCGLPGYVIEIFVNQPRHDRVEAYDRSQVPVSFRATWGVCQNRTGYSQNILANLPRGGKYSAWENQPGNAWQELAHTVFGANNCGAYLCKASRDFAGTLNMSNVVAGVNDTTLNITSSWNWSYFPERLTPANYTPEGRAVIQRYGAIHAVNLWLNLVALPPTPTPTPDPNATPTPLGGPKQCSDTLDNDADAKIDAADPGCHSDRNPDNPATYQPTDDDESDSAADAIITPTPTPVFDPGGVREID